MEKIVLIAIINNVRDLHIANTQHWYRIPTKNAPKDIEKMKYIAFYLTKSFGDKKWSIYYWAEIKSVSIVKRLELLPYEKDHPKANEMYYKIEIDELKALPNPIVNSKGERIVFITTTLERLKTAKSTDDL